MFNDVGRAAEVEAAPIVDRRRRNERHDRMCAIGSYGLPRW